MKKIKQKQISNKKSGKIISAYGKLWPRQIFDIFEKNKLVANNLPFLKKPGVYILYKDDIPYYIGKATVLLYNRLFSHSNKSTDEYFNFWNYFSFFVVPNKNYIDRIEGLLIASLPTANRSKPKIKRANIPTEIAKKLREARRKNFEF